MNPKHRKLKVGQEVIILYRKDLGFVYQKATCSGFEQESLGSSKVDVPLLKFDNDTVIGKDCFWILPVEVEPGETPEQLHRKVHDLNELVSEVAEELCKVKNEHSAPFVSQSEQLANLGKDKDLV